MVLAQKQTWRPVEQNRGPGYEPTWLCPPIFDSVTKDIQWRKGSRSNKCCWEKWLSVYKKLILDPCLSPCTSINSKWIKDLNIRPETLKLVWEWAGNSLEAIGIGKDFLNSTPAAQWEGRVVGKRDRMVNTVQNCVHVSVNVKMIPVETVAWPGEGGIKEHGRRGKFKYDIVNTSIHCQQF
jgi:hypothetical protein